MPDKSLTEICFNIAKYDDQGSFEILFKQFYPKMLSFTQTIVNSREGAEEIVEDVFINLWKNRKTLSAIKTINHYLFTSAKNASLNYLIKNKKQACLSLDEVQIVFQNPSLALNPEEMVISAETIKQVYAVINKLPPKCKLIFRLVKEDGLKYKEVADLLNLSTKTVENHMSTALRKIIEELREIRTTTQSKNRAFR